MEFFKAPPEPPAHLHEPEPQAAEWNGPPPRTLPGALAETLVLAHTDRVAVAVSGLAAYPTGFTFRVETVARANSHEEWAALDQFDLLRPRAGRMTDLPPDLLRYGIEYSDGRRATSLDYLSPTSPQDWSAEAPPSAPLLRPMGGQSGGGRWVQRVWVWPLPPAGPLAFVCEWPALDIPLTRATIDADALLQAAARAVTLWDSPGSAPPSGATAS